jgi:ABC-2 type transport system permease protein
MSSFPGIFRHVFLMSIRRKGLWIAYGLLYLFYCIVLFTPSPLNDVLTVPPDENWIYAGELTFMFNMFMPLVGGILAADRIQRDYKQNMRELQHSTPIRCSIYILGKYFGVLASVLLPMLIWVLLASLGAMFFAKATMGFVFPMLLAFVLLSVPACAFVVAFSVACPLVMPVRVYQILFTGYWFWGNYLNPEAFPTLNGTLLTPGGRFALEAFFGAFTNNDVLYTPQQAGLNLLVLTVCIAAVLFALDRYLQRETRRV